MVSPFESKELRDVDLGDGMDIGLCGFPILNFKNFK
jgi:hypothetical protein